MGPNRRSTGSDARAALFLALATAACGGRWESAPELPTAPRRPDGVALDLPPAMPSASARAPARGVVALSEPIADADVEAVVLAYLRAFEREDEHALLQLLTQDATSLARPGSTRAQLVEGWRTRLRSFEYQRLAGAEIARTSELERHTYETLGRPGSPPRPLAMRPGDLLVRVPIATPRIGSEQLFGDVLLLLLRREQGQLKIAGQAEEG